MCMLNQTNTSHATQSQATHYIQSQLIIYHLFKSTEPSSLRCCSAIPSSYVCVLSDILRANPHQQLVHWHMSLRLVWCWRVAWLRFIVVFIAFTLFLAFIWPRNIVSVRIIALIPVIFLVRAWWRHFNWIYSSFFAVHQYYLYIFT